MIAKKKDGWVWREWLYLIAIVALFAWAMSKPKERIVEAVEEVKREVIVEVEKECDVYVVTATVYHAVEGQCDDSPLVTASGARLVVPRVRMSIGTWRLVGICSMCSLTALWSRLAVVASWMASIA